MEDDSEAPDIAGLTRRIAHGDEAAFREFHRLYFSRLYRFLLAVALGNEDEAAEALQQTMLRVARHIRVFRDEGEFWCWLKVVARSAARDGGRRQSRYRALLERFAASAPLLEPREDDSWEQALLAAMEKLDIPDRELIDAKYFSGLRIVEIAGRTGLSDRAVESRLARIRGELRTLILRYLQAP